MEVSFRIIESPFTLEVSQKEITLSFSFSSSQGRI